MTANLSADEQCRIKQLIGRQPNSVELGIFKAMWSEHCCYKSSKHLLKLLPQSGDHVLCGPGENAGVIDLGDGWGCVFKIESHNHPSFIEPYQGAATGVGGILRDIFTMGARPIAVLDSLHFGRPETMRHHVQGVVKGVGGYSNCIGIPTVGGECRFDSSYDGNILVNVFAAGLVRTDQIFRSAARHVGAKVLYFGAKTGRDGIHGATMASASFDDNSAKKRPTVQVADPFMGKLLLESSLELMASGAILSIQDMGAAGLSSSSFEMASGGGVGIRLDLDKVPIREDNMDAHDLMLSESQERMLAVVKPGLEEQVEMILKRHRVDYAIIGQVVDDRHITGMMGGNEVFHLPVSAVVNDAPVYRRDQVRLAEPKPLSIVAEPSNWNQTIIDIMSSANSASRHWIWQQYDHSVMADTIKGPGGDAAVVRLHDQDRALALCLTSNADYCVADPLLGGELIVAEAWRNIHAVGGRPLGVSDNLNFGNPSKPEIMAQIDGCIRGLATGCRMLEIPIVSGNVSLYNETDDRSIKPTPVIGMIGLIDDLSHVTTLALPDQPITMFMINAQDTDGHLGASLYSRHLRLSNGSPPTMDWTREKRASTFIRQAILDGLACAVHDIGRGGLLVALCRMLLAAKQPLSLRLDPLDDVCPDNIAKHAWLFGEDQGRYCIATNRGQELTQAAKKAGINCQYLGQSLIEDEAKLTWSPILAISLRVLRQGFDNGLTQALGLSNHQPSC